MTSARQWKCEVCGYIHEGPEPPDVCPICGVGPEMFTALDNVLAPDESAAPSPAPTGNEEAARIVIVGGGVAALTAAEHARRASPATEITLVHAEPELPYNRLNLTRLLAGEVDATELSLKTQDWYQSHRVHAMSGQVDEIDAVDRRVTLKDGKSLAYDRLILAVGSHPFVPPIPGANRAGVLSLRTLKDAKDILLRTAGTCRCVCIGGGLLGLETAGALARRGAEVTVLESFDWLLPRQLAKPAAALLLTHVQKQNIQVRCGVAVQEICGDDGVTGVRLKSCETIPADLVVLATGVRPNSYLARQAGLEVNRGIVVDDHMRTSVESIFAAGDVAEHRGQVYGLWPTAVGQGAVAGHNAAGGSPTQFAGVSPASQLKVLDVAMFSVGEFEAKDGSYKIAEKTDSESYVRLVCHDGRLVGANLFGDLELVGMIQKAMENRTPLAQSELRHHFDNCSD